MCNLFFTLSLKCLSIPFFLSFGLFSLFLWFLCCHELIFWRVINLNTRQSPSSKPLKRSLQCRSSLFVFQALVGSPISRACLKRLSTAGSWLWLSYATHLLSSTTTEAAISQHLLWLLEVSTLTFQCKPLRLSQKEEHSSFFMVHFSGDLL